MGFNAVSNNNPVVVIERGGTTLTSGSSYQYGETLTVSYAASGEYVLEVSGASFTTGSCTNKVRVSNSGGSIVMPASGTATIKVWGGWATAKATVQISNAVSLVAPAVPAPAPAPAPAPGPAPGPNPAPNPAPSPAMNMPTSTPTMSSGGAGTGSTESASIAGLPGMTTSKKGGIGFIIGFSIIALAVSVAYLYARHTVDNPDPEPKHISEVTYTAARLYEGAALLLAAICIGLVSNWAKEPTTADGGFLGIPSWETNIFAWHPILMTAGFYCAQIFAICAWSFWSDHYSAKLCHVFFQIAGLASMIAGLWAVVKYKLDGEMAGFVSMHSWVGIAAISMYGFNFAWGSVMALLTRFHPNSIFRKVYNLKEHHKTIGLMALWMTTMSVLTGIMDQISCYVSLPPGAQDYDPAMYYTDLSESCKVANGLGVVVMVSTILVYLGITYRGDSFGFTKKKASAEPAKELPPVVQASVLPSAPTLPTAKQVPSSSRKSYKAAPVVEDEEDPIEARTSDLDFEMVNPHSSRYSQSGGRPGSPMRPVSTRQPASASTAAPAARQTPPPPPPPPRKAPFRAEQDFI